MNKEEIENKKKTLRDFSEEGQGQRVFFEEDLKLIRDILKELEQKESILDKVIDKLKEYLKQIKQDGIYGYDTEIREILEILEGEKK